MKKIFCIIAGLLFCAFSTNSSYAASGDVTQTGGAGGEMTIDTTNNAASADLKFNPSTNVVMMGQSSATSFAVAGFHNQANQKAKGQVYGMATDSNKMFFNDISSTAAPTDISTTTAAAAFSGWYTM